MSDMGEMFNAMKAYKKIKRDERAVMNEELLLKMGIPAVKQSKNVFRLTTPEGVVMYYPSSDTWQHKGKVGHGDVKSFKAWLHSRGMMPK